jgi:hypothetical protein
MSSRRGQSSSFFDSERGRRPANLYNAEPDSRHVLDGREAAFAICNGGGAEPSGTSGSSAMRVAR